MPNMLSQNVYSPNFSKPVKNKKILENVEHVKKKLKNQHVIKNDSYYNKNMLKKLY